MAVEVQYRGDNSDAGPSDGVWFDVDPLASPKKQVEIFEDFTGVSSLIMTGSPPDGADPGGSVLLDTSGDAADSTLAFKLADDKDLTFEARIKIVTAAVLRCGLEDADNSDRLSFEIASDSAVLKHDDATNDETIATKAITAGSYVKLGFRVRGAGANTEITAYADGVKVASKKLSDLTASALSDVMMKVSVVSAGAPDVEVDWIKAVQLR
tara:strand:- start:2427 stop:3059 length:633 start_codon:yes stop_codon:yes gene_type:complete